MKGFTILFLLFIFIIAIKGQEPTGIVYFNSSVDCSNGCSLTNASIYEGGILPNTTNEVIFNVTFTYNNNTDNNNTNNNNTINNNPIWFHLYENETFEVYSLSIFGDSGLRVYDNSVLNVSILYLNNVWLHVHENGSVLVLEEAEIEENSKIINYGYVEILELSSSSNSSIYADNNATFNVHQLEFENGSVVFFQSTNFTSHECEFSDASLLFFNVPYLGDVEFERVDAHFPYGFIVEDHYLISNSNFSAYFPDELANVSLILAGQNNLSVSNLIFASNKIKFNNTGSPFITFTVTNNATFNGTLEVPGEIVVGEGSNVTLDGNITLAGGLIANVNSSTQIKAVGLLKCGNPISLTGRSVASHSFSIDNAIISAPSIQIDNFELNAVGHSSILYGNVINTNSSIHVFESIGLTIHGNYTQNSNATLGIYNVTNSANRTSSIVFIHGSAILDGHMRFNASETTQEFSVTVLKASDSLTGRFTTETYATDDVIGDKFQAKLLYERDYVNVTITPKKGEDKKSHHYYGLDWWAWLLIGVAILVVVLSLVGILVSRSRKRSQYQAVGR